MPQPKEVVNPAALSAIAAVETLAQNGGPEQIPAATWAALIVAMRANLSEDGEIAGTDPNFLDFWASYLYLHQADRYFKLLNRGLGLPEGTKGKNLQIVKFVNDCFGFNWTQQLVDAGATGAKFIEDASPKELLIMDQIKEAFKQVFGPQFFVNENEVDTVLRSPILMLLIRGLSRQSDQAISVQIETAVKSRQKTRPTYL